MGRSTDYQLVFCSHLRSSSHLRHQTSRCYEAEDLGTLTTAWWLIIPSGTSFSYLAQTGPGHSASACHPSSLFWSNSSPPLGVVQLFESTVGFNDCA